MQFCLQFYRKYTFNASTIVNALPLTPVSEVRSGIHNHPLETEIFILTNEPSVCAIFRKKNIPILSLKLSKKTKFVKNCSKGYLLKKKKKPDRILYSRTTGTGNPTENRSCNYIIYILSRYEMKNLAYQPRQNEEIRSMTSGQNRKRRTKKGTKLEVVGGWPIVEEEETSRRDPSNRR